MENKVRLRSLTSSRDFDRLRSEGRVFHVNAWLLVNMQPTDSHVVRCGWTIPRQVGTAVVRNRFRRWGREFLRKWSARGNKSLDINIVFKRREAGFYKRLGHEEFDEAFAKLVGKVERFLN